MSYTDEFASNSPFLLPAIVLDTNVVLDWLVFRSTDSQQLRECLTQGKVRWLASAAMREELFHVLARGTLAAWSPNSIHISAAWDRYCLPAAALAPAGAACRLRCSDPDDQKFIDLAVAHEVRWLLSKDRAVLKLAGRARVFGVEILTPAAWAVRRTSGATASRASQSTALNSRGAPLGLPTLEGPLQGSRFAG